MTSIAKRAQELRSEGLVKSYRGHRVVDEVDISVRRGEVIGLLGPNGAGKTTTFYMMTGLIPTDAGRVMMDAEEVTRLPMYRHARKGIGYLPQEASIFRGLTVRDNVMAILETLPGSRKEREDRLEELLEELKIRHLASQKAHTLSGGERRRVEICRALVTAPAFLLLDEPFAGIDPIAVGDIQEIIAGLRDKGLGILITDHNVRETLHITDRAYILFKGRVLISGTSEELAENPEARAIYLGERFRL
ncbi:MAG: LPS export ABC transporter ATP-binding protein [Gemmatimonadota bacterium]|jgi:lipopolysaccharide export system ATP-binding protein|nr:LPS export ABC transporter ATP-binding protein [Gemmatimonadota bacterium]MDP6529944.1 LPS export ABC transporter ATP-binding protein [Gemmatimonadota bacterium]MDP6802278.1 LPS export ABC transporter ATP-binding protein [Gemmatimonadota bacterium]MDP7031988.1 LPS export ABC transporter ATP-binding protein [Gemmatimonadota bacterium]